MEDNLRDINRVFGDNAGDIGKVIILSNGESSIESVYIFENKDDTVPAAIYDKGELTDKEFFDDVHAFLVKAGATKENRQERWIKVKKENKFGIDFDKLDEAFEKKAKASSEELDMSTGEVELTEEEKEKALAAAKVDPAAKNKKYGKIAGFVAGAALLVGVGYALSSCTDKVGGKGDLPEPEPTPTEAPVIPGNNDEVSDAAEKQQELIKTIVDAQEKANTKASITKHDLSLDDVEAMKAQGQYKDPEYDFARLGFNAGEWFAPQLYYGNYSKDEAIYLSGREVISMDDVIDKPDSQVNEFGETLIYLYLSGVTYNLEEIIPTANKQEIEEFNQFNHYIREIEDYKEANKKDEAAKKLTELRDELITYGYNQNSAKSNIKPLVLKVFWTYGRFNSDALGLKETKEISMFDTKTGKTVSKEMVKEVYWEVDSRNLIEGREGCDSIIDASGVANPAVFLTIEGVSDRYVVFYDETKSIYETLKENNRSKVEEIVAYQEALIAGDQAYHGSFDAIVATSEAEAKTEGYSDYDKLTYGTTPLSEWLADADAKMEDLDIFEANEGYFASVRLGEIYKSLADRFNPNSKGKKGDTWVESTFTNKVYTDPAAVAATYTGNFAADEAAGKDDWANNYQNPEDPEEVGAKDDNDGEKKKEDFEKKCDEIVASTFNHFLLAWDPTVFDRYPDLKMTNDGGRAYDDSWQSSSDSRISGAWKKGHDSAMEAIENCKIIDELNKPTPTPQPQPEQPTPTPKPADPTPTPDEPTPTPSDPTPTEPTDPTPTPDIAPPVDDEATPTPDIAPPVEEDTPNDYGTPQNSDLSVDELKENDGELSQSKKSELLDLVDQLVSSYYSRPEEKETGIARK